MAQATSTVVLAQFQEELSANYLHALLGFSALLEEQLQRDPSNADAFSLLAREALDHFEILPSEFSKEFGVHPSTVGRWGRGKAVPNPLVRPIVLQWIFDRIEREIEVHDPSIESISSLDNKVQKKLDARHQLD